MRKLDRLQPVDIELLNRNIIRAAGEVDGDMALHVEEALFRLTARGSPDVTIMISSPGGRTDYGLDIYDGLRLYAGKLHGIVCGNAASMGAIILQACHKRSATPNANILIHHISSSNVSLDVIDDPRRFEEFRENMRNAQQRLYEILAARTKHPVQLIKGTCSKNEMMTAQEAKKFGLIDDILSPEPFTED